MKLRNRYFFQRNKNFFLDLAFVRQKKKKTRPKTLSWSTCNKKPKILAFGINVFLNRIFQNGIRSNS